MQYKVFGCKTNKYFAEKWLVHPHLSEKKGYFIASCVVTDKAKAKWVKHAQKILPNIATDEKLYLSGCGNIRDGVVDPRFFEVYSELGDYREKIEILPEDPDDWLQTPFVKGGRGDFIPYRNDLKEKAEELRKNLTGPEKNIWFRLLSRDQLGGYRFTRQKPLLDYIVDFYCAELKLAIEIDGESHRDRELYDTSRTEELMKYGIEVIRYTNDDVLKNLDMIKIDLEKRIHNKTQKILRPSGTSFTKGGIQEKIRSLRKIAGKELFTRKYMVIQTGCDNFCTFCLTVQARGRHKWRPMDEIIEEINTFVEGGGKEVVFTGINLGAWGASTSNNYDESRFVELVEEVLEKTSLERLRISSLGVEFCSDALVDLFKNRRINAYAHLSIQSGSSKILESMHRHYDGDRVREVLEKLRTLEREDGVIINIGADLIVGFPGETGEDFEDTLEIVEKYGITQLHAFPFSAHVDHYHVPAGHYPDQIPNHIAQQRLKKLIKTGENVFENFGEKNIGKKVRVLIEKVSGEKFSGWTENYLRVDETNIELLGNPEIARGKVIEGIYLIPIKQKTNED